jgi:isochorismate synthase
MSSTSIPSPGAPLAPTASGLLEAFEPSSPFFLATPSRTLLARGVETAISAPLRDGALVAQVAAALTAGSRAVVGAVPFDDRAAAQLIVPRGLDGAGPLAAPRSTGARLAAELAIRSVPERARYASGVAEAVERMRTGALRKVVLSRTLEVDLQAGLDVRGLLHRLASQNPGGHTFAVALPDAAGARRTLIGASPELLVARSGLTVVAEPLAGSAARSPDPAEDRRRASALLVSAKDRHEHAIVADAVAAALRPYCRHLDVPAVPSLRHTRTMWHLASRISGELADPSMSALALACALHPTPAVCGDPLPMARAAIAEIEPFDRGFFTGMVGWCDASGDGEWAVTIRCAEVAERSLRLFAGAGIVAGSDPEHELAETTAKLQTMLDALGIVRGGEVAS